MKDLADEQSGFYREIGVLLRPATGSGLGRVPCGKRLFGEPDRDIATLAQCFVIFEPVGHFVTRFLDLVRRASRKATRPVGSTSTPWGAAPHPALATGRLAGAGETLATPLSPSVHHCSQRQ